MRDLSNWSLNIGLWGGVRVRLHASFLVVVVLACYLAHLAGMKTSSEADVTAYGLLASLILLASVVVHELGHGIAAWQLGGGMDLVVLGPLGGMNPPHVPHEPQREVIAALAGPLANLLMMLALTPALIVQNVDLGQILKQPLHPAGLLSGSLPLVCVKLAFWINWLLMMVNLFPAAPLDGGRALRSILWPYMTYRGATRVVANSGLVISLCLCVMCWFVYRTGDTRLLPEWAPLATLAVYLFFSSRQEARKIEEEEIDDDLFGYDFSQGYTSLERPSATPRRPNVLKRWLQERRDRKAQRMREIEEDEERRFDEVLIRVKDLGMNGISPEERALMHRVSARYRNRLQH
jgi:stage IV sporulation protein FB